jgi:hypothetical protein
MRSLRFSQQWVMSKELDGVVYWTLRLYAFIILKQPNIGMRMEPQTLGFFC